MAKLRIIDDEAIEAPFNLDQFKRIMGYVRPFAKKMAVALVLMVASAVCMLGMPKLISEAINRNIAPVESQGLGTIALIMAGLALTYAVCLFFRVRIMDTVGFSAIANLREDVFNHVQSLSFSFFDTRSAGKIMVRIINDVNSLNDLFTHGIVNLVVDCVTLFLLLALMFSTNWQLTLAAMCVLPMILFIVFVLKRRMRRNWQVVRMKISNMNGYLHESLSGMRITQAFVREKENAATFSDVNEDIRSSWLRAIRYNMLFRPGLDVTSAVGTVLVYVVGVSVLGVTSGDVSIGLGAVPIGDLLLILWLLGRFWDPLNNLSNFYNSILVAAASMERIFEVLDTTTNIVDKPGSAELPPIKGNVAFDHVTFSYDTDKVVLKDVSVDIRPGQSIALVGPTGAGKSTVVNLISRFYDVTDGSVRIDGRDVRDIQLHSLRKQMSVMMQDSFIFSGTIMDNIRYGRLDATDEEVMDAAKAVRVHDFIMAMEKGYQTEVNERGSRLSVGQKQLISFARALLNDPRILILDEATSSIDTQTELLIQQALDVLLKGRTSFVIAHRLSTIRKADCIFVIQDGKIAEAGNHDQLMEQKGHYYDLCQAQVRFLLEA